MTSTAAAIANRRFSIQVPDGGYTPIQKTAASDTHPQKRRDRSMSIDQRFNTSAQFIESIRKNLGNL